MDTLTDPTRAFPATRTSGTPEDSPGLGRAVEVAVTLVLLLAALPLMAVLWALVRLTSTGPGLYAQRRSGRHGREFTLYKFRSMTANCEDATGAVWASRDDARITAVGKFLRQTHLDELPQLFNVLWGEMALIGPRPERPEIIERLVPQIPDYLARLEVRPGVTGLAQIFLDSDLSLDDVREKLRLDRHYIASRSWWLDARIVACTSLKVAGLNRPWVREILFPMTFALAASRESSGHRSVASRQNHRAEVERLSVPMRGIGPLEVAAQTHREPHRS